MPFINEASIELLEPHTPELYTKYDNLFRRYLVSNHFTNIYLISTINDKIVYSLNTKNNENKKITNELFNSSNFQHLYYSMLIDPEYIKISDFEFFKGDNGKPSAFIATPIFDDNLNIISVLIMQLSIDKIQKIMTGNKNWENEGLGKSGETYIVADDCSMRNDSRFYIENPTYFFRNLQRFDKNLKTIEFTKKYNTNVLIQNIDNKYCEELFLNDKSGISFTKDYRGIYVLSAYAPLDINGVNWYILVEIDKTEVTIPVVFLRNSSFITIVVLFILLLISTHIFSNSITKPINKLKDAFEDLGKGDLSKKIIINRNNEFSSLARSYNKAIKKLEKLTHSVEYLSKVSTTDYLTKIYNRQKFEEDLISNIKRVERTNEIFSIAILDIDHFKNVNDTYGHDRGDEVLKSFTKVVKRNLRKTDIFARWGGEEFIILFIDTRMIDAYNVCDKIRKNIQKESFIEVGTITCSMGITEYKIDDNKKTIVDRADKALYKAKDNGRNQVIQS